MPQATSAEDLPTSPTFRLVHAAERLTEVYERLTGPIAFNAGALPGALSEVRYFACELCCAIKQINARIDEQYGRPKLYPQRPAKDDHHLPCQQCEVVEPKNGKRQQRCRTKR